MSELTSSFARAVTRLNRRLRQERQTDLSPSALAILGDVCKLGTATPGQIAERERVQPPSITRVLNSLESAGLVVRAPHPDDGRQVLVSLSERGNATLDAERERRDAWLCGQLAELTAAERATLAEATEIMNRLAGCE